MNTTDSALTVETSAHSKTNNRIFYWDNLRFLLIVLVVVGHAIDSNLKDYPMYQSLFFFIYTFHMPLFIFVSGLFAKSAVSKDKFRVEKILSYLILYALLEVFIFLIKKYLLEDNVSFRFFYESGLPWYLFGMILWLITTYLIKDLRPSITIPISILIGLLVGYDDSVGDIFCLSRSIVFYPFFLIGYWLDRDKLLEFFSKWKYKLIGLLFLAVTAILILQNIDFFNPYVNVLKGRLSYADMKFPIYGIFYRMLFYVTAALLSVSVMAIIPHCKLLITKFGERTLQVYFLHRLIQYIYRHFGLDSYILEIHPTIGPYLYLILIVIFTMILSLKLFEYPFKKIMNLNLERCKIKQRN